MRAQQLAVFALAFALTAVGAGWGRVQAQSPSPTLRSGSADMSAELQAMQRDDSANPGMLWVAEGEALWRKPIAPGKPACAGCHQDGATSMRGVAARYPAFDAVLQRPVDLHQRIEACRARQGAAPLARESRDALSLEAYVATQSRGLPLAPPADERLAQVVERGRQLFNQRMGQLDLSCAQCHDGQAGGKLGGSTIPQGHPNGYPLYRLEWQGLGSLQRRLRNCLTGVRAQPFEADAPQWVELAAYLAQRARGLPVEAPAIRP